MTPAMKKRIEAFTKLPAKECRNKLSRRSGGGVFYNSVNPVYCPACGGWQDMREAVK